MQTQASPDTARFVAERAPFLGYLKGLESSWTAVPFEDLIAEAGGPENVAVIGVDLLKGFCCEGALASPRVGAIVPAAVRMLTRAHDLGVRHFFFPSDEHPPESLEFRAFPPHCVQGTAEAEIVDEITSLPFANLFHRLPKRSVNSFVETHVDSHLRRLPHLRVLVAMGDVTDICLHTLALHLRSVANSLHLPWTIVVPESGVQTYDLPVDVARQIGAMPHDGDLLHLVFLYHLQLNGVRVVADLV